MTRKYRILIVDDDQAWADFCAREISDDKIVVDTTYDVSGALKLVESSFYDIIFCDIKMASGTERNAGFMVIRRAKHFLPQAKIIMVTAFDSSDFAVKSLRDEKSYDYLAKDSDREIDVISMNQLIKRIAEEQQKKPIASNPFNAQHEQCPSYIIANRRNSSKEEMGLLLECLEQAERSKLTRFLLIGQTGLGKTCVLKHFTRYLNATEDYRCSYCRIPRYGPESSPEEVLGNILLGTIDGFPKTREIDFNKIFESLKKIGIKIGPPGLQGSIEWEVPKRQEIASSKVLKKGLKTLWSDLEKESISAIIFLFDDLQNLQNHPAVLEQLLEVFSGSEFEAKPIVFGASFLGEVGGGAGIVRIGKVDLGRFFAGRIVSLGNFTEDEVEELIEEYLYDTGVVFDESLSHLVYQKTRGHPYQTQVLLYHLYENQRKGIVSRECFSKALQESLIYMTACIPHIYGSIDKEEKALLGLFAGTEHGLNLNEIRHNLVDRDELALIPKADSLCKSLEEKGVLEQDKEGRYVLAQTISRILLPGIN